MVPMKKRLLGIALAMLCTPAFSTTLDEQADRKQQLEFLSFLAFIGSVTEMESAGIDVDQLLDDTSANTQKSPLLPIKESETDE